MARRNHWMILLAIMAGLLGGLIGDGAYAAAVGQSADPTTACVQLSDGVRVELLGIGSLSGRQEQWWRPDGSALAERPYGRVNFTLDDDRAYHVFVVKVVSAHPVGIDHALSDTQLGTSSGPPMDSKGNIVSDRYVIFASAPPIGQRPIDPLNLRIGVSVGSKRVLATHDSHLTWTWAVTYADGGVVFHPPYEQDGKLVVTVAHTDHEPYRKTSVVAYDRQGKPFEASGDMHAKTSGFVSARTIFDGLTKANVSRVELQGQSYEWAVFKDVPLAGGGGRRVATEAWLNPNDRVGDALTATSSTAHLIGKPMQPFTLPDTDGALYRLEDLKGKAVLVNVFATWCGPCRAELPELEKLRKRYGPDKLSIVSIAKMERVATVKAFVRKRALSFPALVDEPGEVVGRFADLMGSVPVPTNVLLGSDRTIVYASRGFSEAGQKALCEAIDSVLAKQDNEN